jgi:hypothetical protein
VSKIKTLGRIIDSNKRDTDNTIAALRLQAQAWRQLAVIACADPKRATGLCQMLLFNTVPWVNGEYVGKFIKDHLADAEECGKRAGVFTT